MRPYVITVVSGLLFVMGIVYWADPGNRWSGDQFPKRALQAGEILINVKTNLDDRALRFSQLGYIERPDLLILGSSRAMQVQATMFKKTVRVYNSAVTVPKVQDYVAFWQTLKKLKKTPRYILIFVDAWVFNQNASFQYHHVTQSLVQEFLFTQSGEKSVKRTLQAYLPHSTIDKALYFINTLPEMLKGMQFKYALIQLALYHGHAPPLEVLPEPRVPKGSHGYRADGSFYDVDVLPKSAKQLEQEILFDLPKRTDGVTFYHWMKDEKAIQLLDLFLKDAAAQGTEVFLVLPPYQHTALTWLKENSEANAGLQQYHQISERVQSAHSEITVCDAVDPRSSQCSETEFNDWFHTNEACTNKIMSHCFEKAQGWKELLSK